MDYDVRLGRADNVSTRKCKVSMCEKMDLTIQRWESKDMYITRTALIYLVTRATNLCPRRFRWRIQNYSALRPFLTRNLVKITPRGKPVS